MSKEVQTIGERIDELAINCFNFYLKLIELNDEDGDFPVKPDRATEDLQMAMYIHSEALKEAEKMIAESKQSDR